MRSFSQLAFLLPLIFGRSYCVRTTIRVGNFIYLDEAPSRVYLNLTVDQIIRERLLPEDFDIQLYHVTGCDHFTAPNASFKLYTEQKVDVLLGPICSSGMEPVGLFAAGWDLPIMGVMSTGHSLTDKKIFSTLSRISITMDLIAEATVALLLRMGWHNIGLVSVADDDPFDTLYPQALKEYAVNHGVSIGVHQKILMNQNKDDRKREMINALNAIKNAARIVIVSLGMEIGDAREFLLLSEQMNMAGSSEYVFIVPWNNHNPDQPLPWNFGDTLDKAAGDIFGKVLTFVPAGYDDANLRKTIASTLRVSHLELGNIERAMYLPNMHDALYLYALCVNACLTDSNCNWRSGRAIFEKARNRIFDGHSGRVIMSDTADRLADFAVLSAEAYNDSASSYQLITRFILEVSSNGQGRNQTWNLKTKNSFSWATIDGTQPPDTPECGFTGTNCGKLLSGETLGLISLTLLCLTIVISFALVRLKQWRFERNLLALSWSVPAAELNQRRATKEDNSSFLHDLETFTVPAGARQSVHMSDLSEDVSQSAESDDDPSGHSFSTIYRGQRVQVRRFRYRYQLDEVTKRHDLLKLKTIKDLNHENLAPFVGVVTDHPKNLMLVWGSADKGSLEFIVHNKERALDIPFQASILKDLVRALEYLHSSKIKYHGRLTIRNCLIDARWVLKVRDYGLRNIIAPFNRIPDNIDLQPERDVKLLLQLAPELLRNEVDMIARGSPEADVYSYGMILYQVLFRIQPYEFSGIASDQEMLEQVRNPDNVLIRPLIPASHGFHVDLVNLIPSCWSEKPLSRPRLARIRNTIFGVLAHYSSNIVDHMVATMETQAADLEQTVATLTKELNEERSKANQFLHQLMPPFIAETLREGQISEAELFDMVTVGIFDVVDFGRITARLTPKQMIKALDQLMVLVDKTVELFDAMKKLSVQGIEGLPTERWQMRVGVHTGAVVAGVVGSTLRRYCLMGDTITIAKCLQCTGEPMRVQIGHTTKVILDRLAKDEFWTERRGMVTIKNKGQRETFWLDRRPPRQSVPK